MKNIIIGIVISIVIFIGLGWLLVGKEKPQPTFDMAISDTDHRSTTATPSAVLVEYSDFQCPVCAAYYEIVSQLKKDLGDQVQIIYRNFPLRQIHKNAQLSAQAAEAAALQNKFWEMHDKLLENQGAWSDLADPTETFVSYATELQLDTAKFTTDLTSQPVIDKVNNDYASGLRFGVNSTPSFYLNGVKMTNPASYETFKEIIQSKIL